MTVASANIYLSCEICDAFLAGVASIALVARDEGVLIVPLVSDSAGGTLLKVRNLRGDRVIHAQEFFRDKGFAEETAAQTIPVRWSCESAALVLEGLRRAQALVQTKFT